jgi:sec-independent protein translocase protein TatB
VIAAAFGLAIGLPYNSSMNFLGVGPAELIVILVVALIFVGPERLPKLAADIARTIREIRQYTGGHAAEFSEVVKDFEKETEGERSSWKEIGEGITGATQSVTDAIREARADAAGTAAPRSLPAPVSADLQPPTDPSASPALAADALPIETEWREIGDAPPAEDAAIGARAASNGNGHSSEPVPAPAPADEAR